MLCPTCSWDNLPGEESCVHCQQDMTLLDQPAATNQIERSLMEDQVKDLGKHTPLVVPTTTSVRTAIDLMLEHNVGALTCGRRQRPDAGDLQRARSAQENRRRP